LKKLNANGNVSWTTQLGENSFLDEAYSVSLTSDGGYIVGGELWGGKDGSGTDEWYIAKYNQSGDTLWTKCLEDHWPGTCYSIIETTDGDFVASGSYNIRTEINPGEYQINQQYGIIKFNNSGDTLWTKDFGGSGSDVAYSVNETSDGGLLLSGTSGSTEFTKGDDDGWVIKLTNDGTLEWEKYLGGSDWDNILSCNKTIDNCYILGGFTTSYDGDLTYYDYMVPNYWIIKIDASGDVIWSESVGGDNQDYGQYVSSTSSGGSLMVGRSWSDNGDASENKGFEDIWIVKFTSTASATTFQDINYMTIYPNPVKEELYINNRSNTHAHGSIFSIQGRLTMILPINAGINTADLSHLNKGIYLLEINHQSGRSFKTIIKQ
jgi:hypothetical protein